MTESIEPLTISFTLKGIDAGVVRRLARIYGLSPSDLGRQFFMEKTSEALEKDAIEAQVIKAAERNIRFTADMEYGIEDSPEKQSFMRSLRQKLNPSEE